MTSTVKLFLGKLHPFCFEELGYIYAYLSIMRIVVD